MGLECLFLIHPIYFEVIDDKDRGTEQPGDGVCPIDYADIHQEQKPDLDVEDPDNAPEIGRAHV